MRALLAIAHYTTERDVTPLLRCVMGWRGAAMWGVQDFHGPCQAHVLVDLDVLVVDDGEHSMAHALPSGIAERVSVSGDPLRLPIACRRIMDERRAGYDMLAYSEHDNWPVTADFFAKTARHARAHPGEALIPNRYERIAEPPYKVYIDGENGWGAYGAMWVVTAAQWEHWRSQPHFLTFTAGPIGPLESGCAWSLLKTFACVKPPLSVLESEHYGDRYAQRSVARGLRNA